MYSLYLCVQMFQVLVFPGKPIREKRKRSKLRADLVAVREQSAGQRLTSVMTYYNLYKLYIIYYRPSMLLTSENETLMYFNVFQTSAPRISFRTCWVKMWAGQSTCRIWCSKKLQDWTDCVQCGTKCWSQTSWICSLHVFRGLNFCPANHYQFARPIAWTRLTTLLDLHLPIVIHQAWILAPACISLSTYYLAQPVVQKAEFVSLYECILSVWFPLQSHVMLSFGRSRCVFLSFSLLLYFFLPFSLSLSRDSATLLPFLSILFLSLLYLRREMED